MIPYPFRYRRAKSVADAEAMLAAAPGAKLLAGGQTLIAAMKMRLANPPELVDISRLGELRFIRRNGDTLVIGAGTTHHAVAASSDVASAIPPLARLAEGIGDPAVRYAGTLGGSLANNDPAADYTAAALALGATMKTNRRTIGADGFFTGMFATALEEDEILTEVSFPLPERAGYCKFRNPASRYAMPGVFVAKSGRNVRVAATGAAPCVFRANALESALGNNFRPEAVKSLLIDSADLMSDIHASAEYRAHLIPVMAARAVAEALA